VQPLNPEAHWGQVRSGTLQQFLKACLGKRRDLAKPLGERFRFRERLDRSLEPIDEDCVYVRLGWYDPYGMSDEWGHVGLILRKLNLESINALACGRLMDLRLN
jgi:hypothetical protein